MKKNYVKPEMTEVIPEFTAMLDVISGSQQSTTPGGESGNEGEESDAKQRGIWGTDKNNLLW